MRHFRVTAGMYWCWQGSWLGKQLCSSQHDAQGLHLELLIRIHKHDHINCLPLPPPSAGTWCALSSHPKHPIPTPAATTCEQGHGWGQGGQQTNVSVSLQPPMGTLCKAPSSIQITEILSKGSQQKTLQAWAGTGRAEHLAQRTTQRLFLQGQEGDTASCAQPEPRLGAGPAS